MLVYLICVQDLVVIKHAVVVGIYLQCSNLTISLLIRRLVSGNCGYGATYCGKGCTSNCDAVAECGKDSKDGKTTCPLNTCCSQYGFCGTTKGTMYSIITESLPSVKILT